jgi:hypothetical protein
MVWPIIVACGVSSGAAALFASNGDERLALLFLLCAGILFGLLFVPGAVALRQFYGWDKK